MIPLNLNNGMTGFVQFFKNTILLAFTNTQSFYNMTQSTMNKKIHDFNTLYGEADNTFKILSKSILGQIPCDELIIQSGQTTISSEDIQMLVTEVTKILT